MLKKLDLFIHRQASGFWRYWLEAVGFALFGWIPTIVGIGLRGIAYRLVLSMRGWAAIDANVRIAYADGVTLESGVYLDRGVYLHATPGGIHLGRNTIVMHGSVLHVYNFRDLPEAGIRVGEDSLIGEYTVIRGQGGVSIGNRVYTSPFCQILAVDHVFGDPSVPFVDQGITAQGIQIEDDVWIGAGAIITDGVHVGRGAVVAAGAIVTHDVPAGSLVAGVPAKVMREIKSDEKPNRELAVFHRKSGR